MASAVPAQFLDALIGELAAAISAVGGSPVPVTPGAGFTGTGLTVSLTVTGALRGTVRLTLDDAGIKAMLNVVLGSDANMADGAAADFVREMVAQAIGSLCLKEPYTKISVAVGAIGRGDTSSDQSVRFALGIGDTALQIVAAATVDAMQVASEAPAVQAKPAPAPRAGGPAMVPAANLDVVMDIELPLSIRFGSTTMSIRALSTLGPGSIVDMGRSPDDPVEVLVCGRVIARAEVVIVSGNYGIRITDLVSATDRIRAMEGQW